MLEDMSNLTTIQALPTDAFLRGYASLRGDREAKDRALTERCRSRRIASLKCRFPALSATRCTSSHAAPPPA